MLSIDYGAGLLSAPACDPDDPDDIDTATVVIREIDEPVAVHLQITALADMTEPEVLELMAVCRK